MQLPSFFRFHKKKIPLYLVLFLSHCYLAFLVSSVQPDVFFSGDGGMKFMVIKQIIGGEGFKYMHLPQPQWVHAIWQKGYFPFRNPFVYPSTGGFLFSFPPYFQLISAVLYSKFGYIGLYILPVLSAVLLWWFLIRLLNHHGISSFNIAIALFILVFCSPLTIYGAAYWEHMPAVLLLFGGTGFLLNSRPHPVSAAVIGLLCGLAVWLRPESLVMDILYGAAALILYVKRRLPAYPVFIIGMLLSIAGFLVFNKMQYGSLLGVHSYQVLQDHGMLYKILKGCKNLLVVNWMSILSFPFVLLLLPVLYCLWKREWPIRLDLPTQLLLFVTVAYCLLTPFMLPNEGGMQWGARYFLPIIPLVVILFALIDQQMKVIENKKLPVWLVTVLLVCTGYSFFLNTFQGGFNKLRWANYHRITPALEFVKQLDGNVIVVGSEYIPMELGSVFNEKYFFLAGNDSSFNKLVSVLKEQGIHECLYINQEELSPGLPNLLLKKPGIKVTETGLIKKGNYYFAKYAIQ